MPNLDKTDPSNHYPILSLKIIFSSVPEGLLLSMYLISYVSPMCTTLPSNSLGILIFTSNVLVFGPVSINEPEFALNLGFASDVRMPPSPLYSRELRGILSSSLESLFASGS